MTDHGKSDEEYKGPVVVTVTRQDTGEVMKTLPLSNDYVLICNGDRYVKSLQVWGSTIQVNIARRK